MNIRTSTSEVQMITLETLIDALAYKQVKVSIRDVIRMAITKRFTPSIAAVIKQLKAGRSPDSFRKEAERDDSRTDQTFTQFQLDLENRMLELLTVTPRPFIELYSILEVSDNSAKQALLRLMAKGLVYQHKLKVNRANSTAWSLTLGEIAA